MKGVLLDTTEALLGRCDLHKGMCSANEDSSSTAFNPVILPGLRLSLHARLWIRILKRSELFNYSVTIDMALLRDSYPCQTLHDSTGPPSSQE